VKNKVMERILNCRDLKECIPLLEVDEFTVLVRLAFCESPRVVIPSARYIPPHLVEVLVDLIVSQGNTTCIELDEQIALAKYTCNRVWLQGEHVKETGILFSDNDVYLKLCKVFHEICLEEYQVLLELIADFRDHSETTDFINARDKDSFNDIWVNIKKNVVDNVWKKDTDNVLFLLHENSYVEVCELCHTLANKAFKELIIKDKIK